MVILSVYFTFNMSNAFQRIMEFSTNELLLCENIPFRETTFIFTKEKNQFSFEDIYVQTFSTLYEKPKISLGQFFLSFTIFVIVR